MRILLSRGLVYQAKKKNETRKNNLRETPLAVTRNKKETKKNTSFKIATNSKQLVRNRDTKQKKRSNK